MHRLFGILATSLWLVAMGELVVHEVWPRWTAQDPPKIVDRARNERSRRTQSAIYDPRQRLVGRVWSRLQPTGDQFHLETTIVLTELASLPPIRIETAFTLTGDGTVDDFDLDLIGVRDPDGNPVKIEMHGESYGRYIPCTLQVGVFRRTFKLESAASRIMGDAIRPFDVLRDLKVGQSWRMQVLDPISAVFNQRTTVNSVVARVERKETILHDGRPVDCFLVVAGRARAWVASDGCVLVQEADVPGIGRLTIRDEPYDEEQWHEARSRVVE